MLSAIEGSYAFLLILIVGFYAGELVWRERSAKLAESDRRAADAQLDSARWRRSVRCSRSFWRSC